MQRCTVGQFIGKPSTLSIEPRWGFVAPHHDYMSYFIEENVNSIQVNVGLLTRGTKAWHIISTIRKLDWDFTTPAWETLPFTGTMNALYLYVDRKFLPQQNRFNLGNRIAFGASLLSKHYDKETNPQNIIIATTLNVYIQYDVIAYYRITPRTNLRWNIGFTHASNGSIRDPNKGFNIVTTGLGIQYTMADERTVFKPDPSTLNDPRTHQLNIGMIYGCKSISRLDNQVYHVSGISTEYMRQINPTTLIGAEAVAYWDPSNEEESDANNAYSYKDIHNLNITLNGNYALKMGRVYFVFQPGLYLLNKVKPYSLITNKVALRFQATPKLFASIAIKAHWLAKADFIEFGIRYNIQNTNVTAFPMQTNNDCSAKPHTDEIRLLHTVIALLASDVADRQISRAKPRSNTS